MKFANLPKQQRVNITKRAKQLRKNLEEYQYDVSNLKGRLLAAEYQVDKTQKEFDKMLAQFEDSATIITS